MRKEAPTAHAQPREASAPTSASGVRVALPKRGETPLQGGVWETMCDDYRLFLTHANEYLVRGQRCIGVRNRRTGRWCDMHEAQGSRVLGSTDATGSRQTLGLLLFRLGDCLLLRGERFQVVTEPILGVERPSSDAVRKAYQDMLVGERAGFSGLF